MEQTVAQKDLSAVMKDLGKMEHQKELKKEREKMDQLREGIKDGLSIDLELDEKLRAIYMGMDIERLRHITEEEFDEIFLIDGQTIRFGEKREFKDTRDAIVYFYEMDLASEKIDEAISDMDKAFEQSKEEMDALFKEFGSYNNILRASLVQDIEKAGEENKEYMQQTLEWYDDALTLNRYEDYIRATSPHRWYTLFYDKTASKSLFERFDRRTKKFNSSIHRGNVNNFLMMEYKHLPEEYHPCVNLFLFTWIRFVSYLSEDKRDHLKRLYALRIALYLKQLMIDTLEDDLKEIFLASIRRILDHLRMGENYHEMETIQRYEEAMSKSFSRESEEDIENTTSSDE